MAERAADIAMSVTHGPGQRVPFAAVIGEFELPAKAGAQLPESIKRLETALPADCLARLQTPAQPDDPVQWMLRLAQTFTEARGRMDLPASCGTTGRRGWMALGYYDAIATRHAMRTSAAVLRAALTGTDTATLKSLVGNTLDLQRRRQPSNNTRALMRVARARAMPVYAVAADSNIWQYGQGRKAWHFHTASTQADANTGVMLQQNKAQSNALVRRLGLPGVEHGIAANAQQAIALARQLGFPLVVKPVDSGQGYGVTAGIHDTQGVSEAYARAVRHSRSRRIIVERHVAGDDFRLMVTGGRFQWAIRRRPPQVTGDGTSTIAELLARANGALDHERIEQGYAKPVAVDDEVRRSLAAAGRRLEDRPSAGDIVQLRSNANVSTGGSFTDVSTLIHPDNCAMAETIARAFRLDSVGIDFLTPDVSRSWREIRCAVIEVNATPMLYSDDHARRLLDSKFPDGGNGRIPSTLILCATPDIRRGLFATLAPPSANTGIATRTEARLNSTIRRLDQGSVAGAAVDALTLDPGCDSLAVLCTLNELRRDGLPLDRFDCCLQFDEAQPGPELHAVLRAACGKIIPISGGTPGDTLPGILG